MKNGLCLNFLTEIDFAIIQMDPIGTAEIVNIKFLTETTFAKTRA